MNPQPNIIQPSRKTGFWHELKKNRAMFLMLLPGVLVLLLYNYLPMFGIIIAFKNFMFADGNFFSSLLKSEWIGLKNFEFLFTTPDAFLITRNTILYNLVFITSCTIIALAFAIMLNEIRSRKLSRFYQGSMFLPYFLSWVVASYLLYSFISPDKGFINMTLFKSLGLKPISWYSETKYWPYIIIIVNAWKWVGNNCIIYLASIIGIDPEFYEAARIDGANRWQQIVHITLPQIMPVIIVMILIFVGRIFNSDIGLFFQVPRNSGLLYSVTQTIDVYVFNSLIRLGDIGMSSAAALYQSVVGFITILVANWAVKKIDPDSAMF